MKLISSRDQLLSCLQTVGSLCNARTTLPILSNVLIRAKKGRLSFATTDLDRRIETSVAAPVIETDGAVTVPVKRLTAIVNALEHPEVEMEADDKSRLRVEAGACTFVLYGLPMEEFPNRTTFQPSVEFEMPQATLKRMLSLTAYAMSKDETRRPLLGLFFEIVNGTLNVVGTDGRRLALASTPVNAAEFSFIVPDATVKEMMRLCGESGNATVTASKVGLRVELNSPAQETVIASALVAAEYPQYRQILPSNHTHRIELPRKEVLAAVKRAALFSTEKARSMKWAFADNLLTITCGTDETGHGREEIVVKFPGKFVSAYNPLYLRDVLDYAEGETVAVELIDEISPAVFKTNDIYAVVMPIRITSSEDNIDSAPRPKKRPEPAMA